MVSQWCGSPAFQLQLKSMHSKEAQKSRILGIEFNTLQPGTSRPCSLCRVRDPSSWCWVFFHSLLFLCSISKIRLIRIFSTPQMSTLTPIIDIICLSILFPSQLSILPFVLLKSPALFPTSIIFIGSFMTVLWPILWKTTDIKHTAKIKQLIFLTAKSGSLPGVGCYTR